ncbi:hypothetical protein CLIB1444_01S12728 [[Candida] jaroonii]|uniref:Uncharacterized protein n=1 Tax=[Candida] jaroonii TaxID=467808 RepID=A0ACA9Y2X5_9ASCO|nr:hypothetical protein CLIB1444_01S12728 [[Candida] jaroonii]
MNPLNSSPSSNIDPQLYNKTPKVKSKEPNFTGWTPLISKNNDMNITPSSKFLNNILVNFNQQPSGDIDYSNGLNLTPFLNHNINLNLLNSNSMNHVINNQIQLQSSNQASSNNQNNGNTSLNMSGLSFTPFHDKSILLSDFFTDSPIKGTPLKDLQTITPSKFLDKKRTSIFQDPKSATKISLNNLNQMNKDKAKILNDETDDEVDNETDDEENKSKKRKFQKIATTPSKILIDITNEQNKLKRTPIKELPMNFRTPAKVIENSSPSTVILSSATKSPKENLPQSPTPNKSFKPMMGTFSEVKEPKSKKKKLNNTPTNLPIKTSIINTNQGTRFKPSNRAQMQAGMNKFQIVLNDGNNVKRGRKSKKSKKTSQPSQPSQTFNSNQSIPQPQIKIPKQHMTTNMQNGEVSNLSVNSMISHNLTQGTDHTSFDIQATPNKFSLDKFFDKNSPNSQNLLNQVLNYKMNPPQIPPNQPQPQNGMMMSTPTHQNVYSDDEGNISLSAFSYFRKELVDNE